MAFIHSPCTTLSALSNSYELFSQFALLTESFNDYQMLLLAVKSGILVDRIIEVASEDVFYLLGAFDVMWAYPRQLNPVGEQVSGHPVGVVVDALSFWLRVFSNLIPDFVLGDPLNHVVVLDP